MILIPFMEIKHLDFLTKGLKMEEIKSYNFSEKEFRQIEKLADDIYSTAIILKEFCENDKYSEDLQNILPVIKFLHQNSDTLNSIFIIYPEKLNEIF